MITIFTTIFLTTPCENNFKLNVSGETLILSILIEQIHSKEIYYKFIINLVDTI